MEAIFHRDEDRASKQELWRTDVTQQAVSLDIFTMMNASDAEQLFIDKTVCEVLMFLSV